MLGKLNRGCMKSSNMLLAVDWMTKPHSVPGYNQSHWRAAPSAGEAPSEGLNEISLLGYLKNQNFHATGKK
jgi:hypothetical protein